MVMRFRIGNQPALFQHNLATLLQILCLALAPAIVKSLRVFLIMAPASRQVLLVCSGTGSSQSSACACFSGNGSSQSAALDFLYSGIGSGQSSVFALPF